MPPTKLPKSPATKPPTKPAAFSVGPVKVRAMRGPHKTDPRSWYWQALRYDGPAQLSLWTGWGRPDDVAREVAALVAKGAMEPAQVKPRVLTLDPERATVAELLGAWRASLNGRSDIRPHTLTSYRCNSQRIGSTIGTVALVRLDRLALDQYRDQRLRARAATATIALELRVLHIAWTWGRQIRLCPDRDLPRTPLKVKGVRDKRTPTPGEVATVISRLQGWHRIGILLLYATGARIGEVAALRCADLDMNRSRVTLTGKTGTRVVPLAPSVLDELRAWSRGTPEAPLLGKRLSTIVAGLPDALAAACEATGIARFTPHGLRRAAADRLLRAGVDIGTAAALLGHTPQVMLTHYRKATDEDLEGAVRRATMGALPAGEVIPFGERLPSV